MQLYDLMSPIESNLAAKADLLHIPLGGTMELTSLCNMDCKMCFIRQNPDEMRKQGRILSCDEWLKIANEAKEAGVLFLLITGGEPLVYPEFKRLYTELTNMGFVITINTNGTLINKEWADFFAKRPCRRLNITVYGKDDKSYEKLCKNPNGHTQLMKALQLLDERNIPYRLNYTINPDNLEQLEYVCSLSKEKKVALESTSYLFPPIRRENNNFIRLQPKLAAQAKIIKARYLYDDMQVKTSAINLLNQMNKPTIANLSDKIVCRAGTSGFWMAWNGDLLPCGMFVEPKISLLEHSFKECWEYIVEETSKLRMYSGCKTCDKRNICSVCAAGCLCESGGDMEAKPEYICEMTEEYYRLLKRIADGSSVDE